MINTPRQRELLRRGRASAADGGPKQAVINTPRDRESCCYAAVPAQPMVALQRQQQPMWGIATSVWAATTSAMRHRSLPLPCASLCPRRWCRGGWGLQDLDCPGAGGASVSRRWHTSFFSHGRAVDQFCFSLQENFFYLASFAKISRFLCNGLLKKKKV